MDDERIAITKVQPRKVERPEHRGDDSRTNRPVDPMELGPVPTLPGDYELTLWEKVRLLPFAFQLFKGVAMKDLKTTITAIVGAAAYVVNALFGIGLPQDAIVAVTVFALGLLAGDSKKD